MSVRILRRFLNTASSGSEINVGEKIKAGWRCIRECLPEVLHYTGIVSPVVIVCNHFVSNKTLERVEREVHNSSARVVWTVDDEEEYLRRYEAFIHIMDENAVLMRQILKLKEELIGTQKWSFRD